MLFRFDVGVSCLFFLPPVDEGVFRESNEGHDYSDTVEGGRITMKRTVKSGSGHKMRPIFSWKYMNNDCGYNNNVKCKRYL